MNITWGIRYHNDGHFHAYLMWMEWKPPHRWLASRRMIRKKYKDLRKAIESLGPANGVDSVVMIFGAAS